MRRLCASVLFIALVVVLVGTTPESVADQPALNELDRELADLYQSGKLFDRKEYPTLRALMTRLFERQFAAQIRQAYGDDYDKLTAWLDARPTLKQDFYTAIDPSADIVVNTLFLFHELWQTDADKVEQFPELAIAISVVWDNDPEVIARAPGKTRLASVRSGVYDYAYHQVRTHSTMPGNLAGPVDNFKFMVEGRDSLKNFAQHLPWEFLIYVIDHRTPLTERAWAFQYFAARIGKVASWHQDVAYDKVMLETERSVGFEKSNCLLQNHEYTLANIKKYGGVCAMQADFAARVGKSLGQPFMYCSGQGATGGRHAWLTYVQVHKAEKKGITFDLLSDGRYFGFEKEHFYVGEVIEPQSGRMIPDRVLEHRLKAVGSDREATRHARLAMRLYSGLARALQLDPPARMDYVDKTLKLSYHCEDAWAALIVLGRGSDLTEEQRKRLAGFRNELITRFTAYPDYLTAVMDPLLASVSDSAGKQAIHEKVMAICLKAGRPDLVCATRLKIVKLQRERKDLAHALEGLATTVKLFPTEGRYVPGLLSEAEEFAADVKTGPKTMAELYVQLAPALVRHYGANTEYGERVYKQGKAYLEKQGQKDLAVRLELAYTLAQRKAAAKK